MDVYINNFLIGRQSQLQQQQSQQEQEEQRNENNNSEKENTYNKNNESPNLILERDSVSNQDDKEKRYNLLLDIYSTKKSPTYSEQNTAYSLFPRKKTTSSSKQEDRKNQKQDYSSRGLESPTTTTTEFIGSHTNILNHTVKGFNLDYNKEDILFQSNNRLFVDNYDIVDNNRQQDFNKEDNIDNDNVDDEEDEDNQQEDNLNYFKLKDSNNNDIVLGGNNNSTTPLMKKNIIKNVKRNYLDELPEANPIAKRELQGIEEVRSAYDYTFKDQRLIETYSDLVNQQSSSSNNQQQKQQQVPQNQPLGLRNTNAINKNAFNNRHQNPFTAVGVPFQVEPSTTTSINNQGLSNNTTTTNQNNMNQGRQFLYQLLQEDNNLVYLNNTILSNTMLCSLYKMTCIRNGEGYQEYKQKEASEQQQQDRLEQIIKENINKQRVVHFESRFESGNLSIASKGKGQDEYNLLLQNDINTKGYTQWFYFSVTKAQRNQTIKFNILNFYKNGSLFNEGMKISIFSKKKYQLTEIGWFKGGFDIGYVKSNIVKQNDNYYYTLTFKYTFEYNGDDEVYFAYNTPYTYTQLNQFLHKCEADPYMNQFLYKKILCRTLIGNRVDLLSITNPCKNTQVKMSERKGVIITARVHPGESVSSYIIEGIIRFLLQNTKEAHFLREKFIFKIIPMLNPDGVIHGNYRCSLAGCDLNRRWKNPNQTLHPEIYYTKQMIFDFKQKNDIAMVIDVHGHSRKMNVFAYGCHNKKKPFECREFPFILSKINPSFSFRDCNFKVQKNREGTARIALYKSLGISNIFTIESSFCGPTHTNTHFTPEHLKEMGQSICQSILMKFEMANYQNYLKQQNLNDQIAQSKDNDKINLISSPQSISQLNPNIVNEETNIPSFFSEMCNESNLQQNKVFLDELYGNPDMIELGMKNDSGSDSEPSEDNMSDDELKKIFTSKTKKSKKQLDKNVKDLAIAPPTLPLQNKDPMSQTQTNFKKKISNNQNIKSPEKKPTGINSNQPGISSTEVKQRSFNFDKAPSPVRSRTVIKNSLYQTGYNFVRDKNLKLDKEQNQNNPKQLTVLEPKFVYFPLKVPDAFPNIDRFKQSLRESKLRTLRENSQIRQQMGNPQQTHRVIQMKIRQSFNNNNNNNNNDYNYGQKQFDQKKQQNLREQISPREFKFNHAIPQPIENQQIDYSNPSYSGIRDAVNTNKSQLGRILRTIMNTQTPDWVYGYQGGSNSQFETLNKSFVQESSQTLSRGQSKQFKLNNSQIPPSPQVIIDEKKLRPKSNDFTQYVFKMQKYDIFNGNVESNTGTTNNNNNEGNKTSNKSLNEEKQLLYQPTLSEYKTLQKGRFDQTCLIPSSAQSSLNNSHTSINSHFNQPKIIKPQSAPRTNVRKSLVTYQRVGNGKTNNNNSMINNNNNNECYKQVQNITNDYGYYNGLSNVVVGNGGGGGDDQSTIKETSVFSPLKIVHV